MDNLTTVTGRNVKFVETELRTSNILNINHSDVKRNYKFCPITVEDEWKMNFVREITNVKNNVLEIELNGPEQFTHAELLDYIVTC